MQSGFWLRPSDQWRAAHKMAHKVGPSGRPAAIHWSCMDSGGVGIDYGWLAFPFRGGEGGSAGGGRISRGRHTLSRRIICRKNLSADHYIDNRGAMIRGASSGMEESRPRSDQDMERAGGSPPAGAPGKS